MPSLSGIHYLVLQGGSVRGVAYLGALEQIIEEGLMLESIKAVAGTSAGAITAFLLALGYSLPELKHELNLMDFKAFLDESGSGTREVVLQVAGARKQPGYGSLDFFSQSLSHPSTTSTLASRLSQGFGIYEGEFFRQWIEDRSYLKTNIHH